MVSCIGKRLVPEKAAACFRHERIDLATQRYDTSTTAARNFLTRLQHSQLLLTKCGAIGRRRLVNSLHVVVSRLTVIAHHAHLDYWLTQWTQHARAITLFTSRRADLRDMSTLLDGATRTTARPLLLYRFWWRLQVLTAASTHFPLLVGAQQAAQFYNSVEPRGFHGHLLLDLERSR